jgi:hypothetical protein
MTRRTSAADELQRIDTVGNVFRNFATVVVVLVAGMAVLNELGISIASQDQDRSARAMEREARVPAPPQRGVHRPRDKDALR